MLNRNKISEIQISKKHFHWVALGIFVVMVLLVSGAAVNIDEILHYNHAKKVVNWYATSGNDVSCFDTPTSHLKYYGQSIDNLSALVNRVFSIENEYLTRHWIGLVTGFLLVFVIGLLAVEISGSYLAGIIAMLLFFISPRMMGQVFGNLKDIPFALGYTWGVLALFRIVKQLPKPDWKNIISFALAIAFTNSVRIGGLILFPYLGLFFLVWCSINYRQNKSILFAPKTWIDIFAKGFVIVIVGYFLGLLFWPYGLDKPLTNPLHALSVMEHYKISIKQIFEGEVIWSTLMPWYYLPKWILISWPEIVLVGFPLFFILVKNQIKKVNKDLLLQYAMLLFVFVFPFVYVILIGANLYSGWRQMFFIYTPFVVMSALGIEYVVTKFRNTKRYIVVAIIVLLATFPIVHSIKTYPSDYIYFNSFAGFNKNAWSNYEYDYYWHEMKKGAQWLENEVEGLDKSITVATNLDLSPYLYKNKNIEFKYVHYYDKISVDWDYAILGVNYVHPWQLKNNLWNHKGVTKTFYHKGNPSVVILDKQDKDAHLGYLAFKSQNYTEAIRYLSKASGNDPQDINILSYLGESYLAVDEWEKVEEVVKNGLTIHPFYEPFKLLRAKVQIKQNNFEAGLQLLKDLLKINPRYFKAIPYLIKCYEGTGQTEMANSLKNKYSVK